MNKALFDTNIWVDIILKRDAFYFHSFGAYLGCLEDDITVIIAATSLKDVFYWAAKSKDAETAHDAIGKIMQTAEVAAVDKFVCEKARNLKHPNFEDGIIAACAMTESVDAIITRDAKAFTELDIPKYTPEDLLRKQGWEEIEIM